MKINQINMNKGNVYNMPFKVGDRVEKLIKDTEPDVGKIMSIQVVVGYFYNGELRLKSYRPEELKRYEQEETNQTPKE